MLKPFSKKEDVCCITRGKYRVLKVELFTFSALTFFNHCALNQESWLHFSWLKILAYAKANNRKFLMKSAFKSTESESTRQPWEWSHSWGLFWDWFSTTCRVEHYSPERIICWTLHQECMSYVMTGGASCST